MMQAYAGRDLDLKRASVVEMEATLDQMWGELLDLVECKRCALDMCAEAGWAIQYEAALLAASPTEPSDLADD